MVNHNKPQPQVRPNEVAIPLVGIEVPLLLADTGYMPRHADVYFKGSEGETVRGLREALNAAHMRLEDGRHVESNTDALRWLIQEVGRKAAESQAPQAS